MALGEIRLEWIRGTLNPADIFNKNVTAALLNLHQSRLGFVTVRDSPAESLFELSLQRGRIDVRQMFVEPFGLRGPVDVQVCLRACLCLSGRPCTLRIYTPLENPALLRGRAQSSSIPTRSAMTASEV